MLFGHCEGNRSPASYSACFRAVRIAPISPRLKIGLGTLRQEHAPRAFKAARAWSSVAAVPGRAVSGSGSEPGYQIKAAAPLPLISVEWIARVEPDRPNVHVSVVDQSALLSGLGIVAAGEGGYAQ